VNKTWVLVVCLSLVWFAQARPTASDTSEEHWVGTWACSPQLGDTANAPPAPGFHDTTLRQIVHASIAGKRIRLRFSNAFGATALAIASVQVALPAGGSAGTIKPESDRVVTFHAQTSVAIPAGALMVSDPIDFDLAPLSDLAISIHLNDVPERITVHPGSRTISYLQAGDSVAAADMKGAAQIEHWYFLNGVDVQAKKASASIVTLGDSITDGAKTTTNKNTRWPDDLARRLQAGRKTKLIAVLNQGIGGNRLLRDRIGSNALARLDRDVLVQTGARWVIVLEGVNDIGVAAKSGFSDEQTVTAQDIIAAYMQIILRAHTHHLRVYGATILPFGGSFYSTPHSEEVRTAVNTWIRASGKFDAVIDFDAATRDPQNPLQLAPAADSGDHLHPNDTGYKMMSDAIDLKLFAK